jgi:spore coat protein U-like protein
VKQALRLLLLLFFAVSFHAAAVNDQNRNSSPTVVRLEILKGCLLNNTASGSVALGTLNFGDVYATNLARDAVTKSGNGNIELRCTPGTTAQITMNAGLYGGTINNRKMRHTSANSTLNYQLYTSANYSTIWDDSTGVSVIFTADETQFIPIYGRIPAQATPLSGVYTDLIVVTVSY